MRGAATLMVMLLSKRVTLAARRGARRVGLCPPTTKTLAFAGAGFATAAFRRARRVSLRPVVAMSTHPAYRLVSEEKVEEYGSECYVYEHEKTKAQVLSVVAPKDENKVFGVVFRTPPTDSTGLPHILEHSVLCGSKDFPTKEPFVELLKGSLQTFLNAFTYPDRTCYPVASQNQKDLENLAHVYLDAVFRPRAVDDPFVLKQEGWHYEIVPDGLEYKGVVYNEMKGVYSSPEALMQRAAQQALFPDNAYAVDSGGDPEDIPNLTFRDFQKFHQKYYTPSNAKIFFYGDDDPDKRLAFLDDYFTNKLGDVAAVETTPGRRKKEETQVGRQRLTLTEPLHLQVPFPSAETKSMVSVNWLLTDHVVSPKEELGFAVLDHLLGGTPSSTLRKALQDSGLGESVIGGGLSDELIQPTFSVGLKGVASHEDVQKTEALIEETLLKLAETGFDDDDVKASLNTVEFQLREFNTGSFPKGLSFMLGAMRNWIYERDPVEALRFEQPLAELKRELKENPSYFQNLIRHYLLDNSHRAIVEMVPDATIEAAQKAKEVQKLKDAQAKMTAEDLKQVQAEMEELQRRQAAPDTPEALATIPTLNRQTDLSPNIATIGTDVVTTLSEQTTLLERDLPTSGIAYVDVAFDLSGLDVESEVPLMPYLARLLTETGTSTMDAVTLQRKIGAETGGLSASLLTTMKVDDVVVDPEDVVYQLVLRGKATKFQTGELFALLTDVAKNADLQGGQARFVEILKESNARFESMFRTAGQALAATRIGAGLTRAGYLNEVSGGVSHYFLIPALLEKAQNDWPSVLATLEGMRAKILSSSVVVNLTGDAATLENARTDAAAFSEKTLTSADVVENKQDWAAAAPLSTMARHQNEGFAVPTQVNYVAKGGRFYAPGQQPAGADSVVRRVVSLDYLWNKVRVMGGAYGGSCNVNPTTGTFAFSSYRDPNLAQTLQTYDATPDYLKATAENLDQTELDKAVIATVGDLDSPLTPDQKGFQALRYFLDGTTDAVRQHWRDQVLATDHAAFADVAAKLTNMQDTKAVVFASKAALDEANAQLPADQQLHVTTLLS